MVWDAATLDMLKQGIWETLLMTFVSSFLAYVIGIPLGIILVVTDADGIKPFPVTVPSPFQVTVKPSDWAITRRGTMMTASTDTSSPLISKV